MRQSPITRCSACDISEDDWTPGCRTCTARHYKRAIRSEDPVTLVRYRATAGDHAAVRTMDVARRIRDGELLTSAAWLSRGHHGRWIRGASA